MSILALVALAILWSIVLIPDLIRRGAASRRGDSIGNFTRQLSVLDSATPHRGARAAARSNQGPRPATPAPRIAPSNTVTMAQARVEAEAPLPPAPKTRLQQRRQDVLTGLVAAAALSFLGTFSFGGPMIIVNAICDGALVAYMAALFVVTRREPRAASIATTYKYPAPQLTPLVPVISQRRSPFR